jgi:hypothetical protein
LAVAAATHRRITGGQHLAETHRAEKPHQSRFSFALILLSRFCWSAAPVHRGQCGQGPQPLLSPLPLLMALGKSCPPRAEFGRGLPINDQRCSVLRWRNKWHLNWFHERRASNTDTGVFLRSRRQIMSLELPPFIRGSDLILAGSARLNSPDGLRCRCLQSRSAGMR